MTIRVGRLYERNAANGIKGCNVKATYLKANMTVETTWPEQTRGTLFTRPRKTFTAGRVARRQEKSSIQDT